MNFFKRHKAIAIILKTVLLTGLTYIGSILINGLFFGGISADWLNSIQKIILAAGGTAGLVAELTYLFGGLSNTAKVKKANERADNMKESIENGQEKLKDLRVSPGRNAPEVDYVTVSQDCVNNKANYETQKVLTEDAINKGKAAGTAIVEIFRTNDVLNEMLTKNVELTEKGNKFAEIISKIEKGTATKDEIKKALNDAKDFCDQQIKDNQEIGHAVKSAEKEAIRLTR